MKIKLVFQDDRQQKLKSYLRVGKALELSPLRMKILFDKGTIEEADCVDCGTTLFELASVLFKNGVQFEVTVKMSWGLRTLYSSAEWEDFLSLPWPEPPRVLDLTPPQGFVDVREMEVAEWLDSDCPGVHFKAEEADRESITEVMDRHPFPRGKLLGTLENGRWLVAGDIDSVQAVVLDLMVPQDEVLKNAQLALEKLQECLKLLGVQPSS